MNLWDPFRFFTQAWTDKGFARSRRRQRAGAEPPQGWRRWLWPLGGMSLLTGLHFFLLPIAPRLTSDFPGLGEISEVEIRAPFDFRAPVPEQDIEMSQFQRALKEPPVFERLPGQETLTADRLTVLTRTVQGLADLENYTRRERLDYLALHLTEWETADLERLETLPAPQLFVEASVTSISTLLASGIVDELPAGDFQKLRVLSGSSEAIVDIDAIVLQARVRSRLSELLVTSGFDTVTADWGARLLQPLVVPNLIYKADQTRARRLAARQSALTERELLQGERIVDRGERVSAHDELALNTLEALLAARGHGEDLSGLIGRQISRLLLVAGLLALYHWMLFQYVPSLFLDLRKFVSLVLVVALFLVGTSFALGRASLGVFAVPITWLSVLVTTLFRGRVGYPTVVLAVALLVFAVQSTLLSLLAWLVLGLTSVTLVRRIRQRDQFYKAIAVLAGFGMLMVVMLDLAQGGGAGSIWPRLLVAALTPVASVALALFLLPIVEPLVGVSSDLTLLELSDLNHPLLKKMALECQGTFHHSQVVGQLAENAARAIGANSLLSRVGALFHDIGKMTKPEYFVENQSGGPNKHDELSPSMSALIVGAHVKEGMELGRRWRLPQVVIDFIPEHHGTQVMKYFYHKALDDSGNETVSVDDYRYPGPKPRGQTAILMLADASEAATRSLPKPTPGRVREMVKLIFDERMLNGEMDECGLTMRDLATIRESFIPLLTSIHHARIAYPGQKKPETNGEEESA